MGICANIFIAFIILPPNFDVPIYQFNMHSLYSLDEMEAELNNGKAQFEIMKQEDLSAAEKERQLLELRAKELEEMVSPLFSLLRLSHKYIYAYEAMISLCVSLFIFSRLFIIIFLV